MIKKMYFFGLILFFQLVIVRSQTLDYATLFIDKVNLSGINSGEDVKVQVRLKEKSEGLITGLQFFIGFDHTILTWKGTWENPQTGIVSIHENMAYNSHLMCIACERQAIELGKRYL